MIIHKYQDFNILLDSVKENPYKVEYHERFDKNDKLIVGFKNTQAIWLINSIDFLKTADKREWKAYNCIEGKKRFLDKLNKGKN